MRALAFTGGGFDTAMQLGVVHALLVSGGIPPDVVVGVSAGAVNAVALADILQAGEQAESPDERTFARVARFREAFEAFQNAPGDMFTALVPDPYQLEAKHPLKPLEVPIHHRAERVERNELLESRFGLINIGNFLLRLRLSIGVLTRTIRRLLSWSAAKEIRSWPKRQLANWNTMRGIWALAATNIIRVSPIAWNAAKLLLFTRPPRETGVTAGDVLFRWRSIEGVWRIVGAVAALLLTIVVLVLGFAALVIWLLVIGVAIGPAVVGRLTARGVGSAATALPDPVQRLTRAVRQAWRVRRWRRRHQGPSLPQRLLMRLLRRFAINRGLLSPHVLRWLFVRLFDDQYYGRRQMDTVVERSLQDDQSASDWPRAERFLSWYADASRASPIHVKVLAADVATGELKALPDHVSVVDALRAATAVTPLFPAEPIEGRIYVDGVNLANEPVRPLIDFLRDKIDQASGLHIYPVAPAPFTKSELPLGENDNEEYVSLVRVVARAWQLKRLRDATLERRLTELYTRTLPPTGTVQDCGGEKFVRAWVYPIEAEAPLNLTERLLKESSTTGRRRLLRETVADGCRAALEMMIQPAIGRAGGTGAAPVKCRLAISAHSGTDFAPMPGSALTGGPGLPEVCTDCAIRRVASPGSQDSTALRQALRAGTGGPAWPRTPAPEFEGKRLVVPKTNYQAETGRLVETWAMEQRQASIAARWPRVRDGCPGNERPVISLLFSGGVFRGVYQIGVLNALSEVGLRPDLIAGASVGSITAVLAAEVFRHAGIDDRSARVARVAAAFLALDRLVLTDRFSDFIRLFTIRAAEARFSLQEADRVFRIYDRGLGDTFSRQARRVAAGLERLFYVSPFELRDLVEAFRRRQTGKIADQLRDYFQEWLDRGEVGQEILGAEPLELLMTEEVLRPHFEVAGQSIPTSVPFDLFGADGIQLLATTTNLTQGRLEILGERQRGRGEQAAVLTEALLASSAFPGVFRPRWSWEVMPGSDRKDQYIDGGVMDNLPLDGVAQFLHKAAKAKLIAARPGGDRPHLIFTASLEPDLDALTRRQVAQIRESWPELLLRTRQLRYNKKVESFAKTQRDLRRIVQSKGLPPGDWLPLDLEVVVVRPTWLCQTFAFHPMLGFRRAKQAASIAHGCASTLVKLGAVAHATESSSWAEAWGLSKGVLPQDRNGAPQSALLPQDNGPDKCWFRPGIDCPFSHSRLVPLELLPQTARELEGIYYACGRPETHRP